MLGLEFCNHMEQYSSDETLIEKNIKQAKSGDNDAWDYLCEKFSVYIHKRAWTKLADIDMPSDKKKELEGELYQAGWLGFIRALKRFCPNGGSKFITYATYYVDGEIAKELDLQLNVLGLTERPIKKSDKSDTSNIVKVDIDDTNTLIAQSLLSRISNEGISVAEVKDLGKYSAERRTLQLIEILRLLTDEEHTLSKEELKNLLRLYRIAKYQNGTKSETDNTFISSLEEILSEVNPEKYTAENEKDYRIKYAGYKENRLSANKEKSGKAQSITDFSYTHIFSNAELDRLIAIVCFTDLLSYEEKAGLTEKLVSTASLYYKSPFYDGDHLKFNPNAVHGRFTGRHFSAIDDLANKVKQLQDAINNLAQIRFRFNRYNDKYELEYTDEYLHTLSPYHVVMYQDHYYCIGLKDDGEKVWHYRIDLMSDLEIVRGEDGKMVPVKVAAFEGLPIANAYWNPEKYMTEHLYMAYDEPRDILLRIKNTDYTILHDWFGNHYEKTECSDEEGYDFVKVKTSPTMIVPWAMQYAGRVEVMDEEVRRNIRERIKTIEKSINDY